MTTPFQAIVWGRVLPLETFDQAKIIAFCEQWGERTNPEKQCAVPSAEPEHVSTAPAASAAAPSPSATPTASAVPSAPSAAPAEHRAPSPELTEATRHAPRLVSRVRRTAAPAVLVGDRVIPLFDGFLIGHGPRPRVARRLPPPGGDARGRGRHPARRRRARRAAPDPGQDRLRRPQLPASTSPRAAAPPPTRPLLFSKFANAVIGDGEPIVRPGGHPRARPRGRARRRHRHDRPSRPARGRARPRRRLRRRQRRQRPRLAGHPGGARRGRGRRRPVAAGQGLGHVPADGLGLRHRRRDPGPAGAPPPLVADPRLRPGRRRPRS